MYRTAMDGAGAQSPAPHAPSMRRPDKELVTGWLLLSLVHGPSHGYALCRELHRHGIRLDASAAYRHLRRLEQDELVESRWLESHAGPPRRTYRLTRRGRRRLERLAATIGAMHDLHDGFVSAYADRATQPGPSDPPAAPAPDDGDADLGGGRQRNVPPSYTPGALRPERELLAGWLLLLLSSGPSYGYELRRRLEDHGVNIDAGNVYEMLRSLETSGWLQSKWMSSRAGPRRRFYRLTVKGGSTLAELVTLMTRARDAYAAFAAAYEARPRRGRGQPAPGRRAVR